jgi:hypothetical protein
MWTPKRVSCSLGPIAGCWVGLAASAFSATPAEDYFESKVRPVLIRNCYACHAAGQTSGLRLDSRDALLKGGTRGPAVVPSKPEESLLVKAIHYEDRRLRMPPPGQLSPEEVTALEQRIRDGAPWPDKPPAAPVRVITEKERSFWSIGETVTRHGLPEAVSSLASLMENRTTTVTKSLKTGATFTTSRPPS